jgi:hypothetical protein
MGNAICECSGLIPTNDTEVDLELMKSRRLAMARQRLIYHYRQQSDAELNGNRPSHSYLMVTEEIDWPTPDKPCTKIEKDLDKTKKT